MLSVQQSLSNRKACVPEILCSLHDQTQRGVKLIPSSIMPGGSKKQRVGDTVLKTF